MPRFFCLPSILSVFFAWLVYWELRKPWQSVAVALRNYERTKGKVSIGQGKEAKEARSGGGGATGREGRNERGCRETGKTAGFRICK